MWPYCPLHINGSAGGKDNSGRNRMSVCLVAQIRKLRRELEAAHEKVNTLTTQLNTNVRQASI